MLVPVLACVAHLLPLCLSLICRSLTRAGLRGRRRGIAVVTSVSGDTKILKPGQPTAGSVYAALGEERCKGPRQAHGPAFLWSARCPDLLPGASVLAVTGDHVSAVHSLCSMHFRGFYVSLFSPSRAAGANIC